MCPGTRSRLDGRSLPTCSAAPPRPIVSNRDSSGGMRMNEAYDRLEAFTEAACAPLGGGHSSGTLDDARAILASHTALSGQSIHAAAVLGDDVAVRGWLDKDAGLATSEGGPRGWDALTYLCFSRYLRLDPERSEAFVRAATALLDAGADPNSGWYETNHRP